MNRASLLCVGAGAVALGIALLLSLAAGIRVMPSYLAAWLFFLAVPLGALPLVMALELAGLGASALAGHLRGVLMALPVAALLAIPVLIGVRELYPWSASPLPGFAGGWWTPGGFTIRCVVFLAIWTLLGLVYARRPTPRSARWRRKLAVPGLGLHLVMGTLAAGDWAMSLEPGLNSSSFGLLLIAAQCGIALSAALLLAAAGRDGVAAAMGARLLLVLLGAWMFLHFTQYLIVWSADLPNEIVWYRQRDSGLGRGAEWFALACFLLALIALLPRRFAGSIAAVGAMAALVLLLHLVETLWMVAPAFRGQFALRWTDPLLLIGVGGLVAGCALGLGHRFGAPPPSGGHAVGR